MERTRTRDWRGVATTTGHTVTKTCNGAALDERHVLTLQIAVDGCEAAVAASLAVLVIKTTHHHGVAVAIVEYSLLACRCLPTLSEAITLAGLGAVCNARQ